MDRIAQFYNFAIQLDTTKKGPDGLYKDSELAVF